MLSASVVGILYIYNIMEGREREEFFVIVHILLQCFCVECKCVNITLNINVIMDCWIKVFIF